MTAARMVLKGKKLGILLSAPPDRPNFNHGLKLAQTALAAGVDVYLYCIDQAVAGALDPRLHLLKERGLKLFACAYGARKRNLQPGEAAVLAGLTVVADLISATDRFVSFN